MSNLNIEQRQMSDLEYQTKMQTHPNTFRTIGDSQFKRILEEKILQDRNKQNNHMR